MTINELKIKIQVGECVDVECKKAESNVLKSVYKTYSAFANTEDGYIILGVKEDKRAKSADKRF